MKPFVLLLITAMAGAAIAAEAESESRTLPGIDAGEKAPSFELPDQNGERRSLQGLLESGPVALVFFRSADW